MADERKQPFVIVWRSEIHQYIFAHQSKGLAVVLVRPANKINHLFLFEGNIFHKHYLIGINEEIDSPEQKIHNHFIVRIRTQRIGDILYNCVDSLKLTLFPLVQSFPSLPDLRLNHRLLQEAYQLLVGV
jgi:hypothetical protein